MKRLIFFGLIGIQIIIIGFFVFQLEQIYTTGKEIKLVTLDENDIYMKDVPLWDNAYMHYDITRIPKEKWTGASELSYQKQVYVLLKQGEDGLYYVDTSTDKKLTTTVAEDVVVLGKYYYYDTDQQYYEINYDFQHVNNMNEFGTFYFNDQLIVSIQLGKWNQYEIVNVEKVPE